MISRFRVSMTLLFAVFFVVSCATAPSPPAATTTPTITPSEVQVETAGERSYLAQLPPLIDRELFFGDPEISGAQISPDGRFISFIKPYKGVRNIWFKGIKEPWTAARPLSADLKRPVSNYFWSEDGRY